MRPVPSSLNESEGATLTMGGFQSDVRQSHLGGRAVNALASGLTRTGEISERKPRDPSEPPAEEPTSGEELSPTGMKSQDKALARPVPFPHAAPVRACPQCLILPVFYKSLAPQRQDSEQKESRGSRGMGPSLL